MPVIVLLVLGGFAAMIFWTMFPEIEPLPPVEAAEPEEVEQLRLTLMRHTGQTIGELQRIRGHWHAFTAYGWVAVEELLRQKFSEGVR